MHQRFNLIGHPPLVWSIKRWQSYLVASHRMSLTQKLVEIQKFLLFPQKQPFYQYCINSASGWQRHVRSFLTNMSSILVSFQHKLDTI